MRAEFVYDDQGLTRRPGESAPKPKPTLAPGDPVVTLKLDGRLGRSTEYAVAAEMATRSGDLLAYGYVTHWISRLIGFSIGRMRVMQGGWDQALAGYNRLSRAVYTDSLVFAPYEDMLALHLNIAGRVTLQLLDDTPVPRAQVPPVAAEVVAGQSLTWVLGWVGAFGPIAPLLDFGSFDHNRSRWFDAGFKTKINALSATLDLYQQTRASKVKLPGRPGVVKQPAENLQSVTLYAAYEFPGVITPWGFIASFESDQPRDDQLGLVDRTYNSVRTLEDGSEELVFDDNGKDWGVGMDVPVVGTHWTPFLAVLSRSGRFQRAGAVAAPGAGPQPVKLGDRAGIQVRLGVFGAL